MEFHDGGQAFSKSTLGVLKSAMGEKENPHSE